MDVVAVPVDGPEVDADMAGQPALGRVDQDAEIGIRPNDMAPGQLLDDAPAEDARMQGLDLLPGGVAIEDVDLDANWGCLISPICGV